MNCVRCGTDYSDNFYKDEYSDEIICEECLLESDMITTDTVTSYYLDGEYIGNDNDIEEVIDSICNNGFKKHIFCLSKSVKCCVENILKSIKYIKSH